MGNVRISKAHTQRRTRENMRGSVSAQLRGEQRNTEAAVYHLKHKMQRIVKIPRVANHS